MKLLLTSAGLSNKSIEKAFNDLVNLPNDKIHIAYIPTASNVESGDKGWLIDDYTKLKSLNYTVDIVDISALTKSIWLPRLSASNVIFVGGGNTFHLMHWLDKSGLTEQLLKLLKTRVYVGISAGSCVMGPTVYNSVQNLFGEKYDLVVEKGLGFVNFHTIPHLNSDYFPLVRLENLEVASQNLTEPVYALDDESAVIVNGDQIQVISEGVWKKYN